MSTIKIYTAQQSERLRYVLNWIFNQRLDVQYELIIDKNAAHIVHGDVVTNAISIPDKNLLWEKRISKQQIETGNWKNIPTLYSDSNNSYDVPFDIFSAVFFLLSRYEEYYPFTPDKHNRYPASESILYKLDCLRRPIVDEWVEQLRILLNENAVIDISKPLFTYQPTYDIDIAWSFSNKGLKRNAGGLVKDVLNGNIKSAGERAQVLSGAKEDPYDSFDWLQQLHSKTKHKPIYFILATAERTDFDKNISPEHPAMQTLIKKLSAEGIIGIHPSYYTDTKDGLAASEKKMVENISVTSIHKSRQHYIKMQIPATYRRLLEIGITEDYSMGYGTNLGFRAGTGSSFFWYDIENEKQSELHVYPFCFMDTTARFDEQLSVTEAFNKSNEMRSTLKQCGGMLISVFHNFSLGSDAEWKGWNKAYETFLQ